MHRAWFLAAALVAVSLSAAAQEEHEDDHDPFHLAGDVTLVFNDNVTRAEQDADIAEDVSVEASLAYGWNSEGITGSSVGWTVSLTGAKFDEFEDLDHAELKGEAFYRVQFARGFGAPVYELSAAASALDYGSEIRDGWQVELGAMATKRLTDRLTGRAGLRYTQREADDFEVFDIERGSIFVNTDWLASRRSVGYGTYVFASGDVVSTAEPTLNIINWAQAIEPDDAFGGVPANRFAYRLEAEVHIVTIGYNRSLDPDTSFDVSLEGLAANADGGNDYERAIARVSYLRRF